MAWHWCSTESGLGALHVSQARASYPSLQTCFAQRKVNLEMNQDKVELKPLDINIRNY